MTCVNKPEGSGGPGLLLVWDAWLQCMCCDGLLIAVQVRMLSADEELNEDTLRGILQSGHSRVPVHRPGNR